MTFQEFQKKANRFAEYLGTKVTRVFESDGNYKALLKECDAFDRMSVTGTASSQVPYFHYGDGHTRALPI